MQGYELSDFEWDVIAPLLPNKPRGVPRVDDRRVLNGIFWVLREHRGGHCRKSSAPRRLATTALCGGAGPGFGTAFWLLSQPLTMATCR